MKKSKEKSKTKVLIATPTMDGRLEAYYVDSLVRTLALGSVKGYDIAHLFVGYDSMLPRARNDLVKAGLEGKFDEVVFIDADMLWNPEWVIELLESGLDFVGGTARKKSDDNIDYAIKIKGDLLNPTYAKDHPEIMEVETVGTGFLKVSKKVLEKIGKSSKDYYNGPSKERANKMYFEYTIDENGDLLGEDATLCKKWRDEGGKCYLHTKMTCGHVGTKVFFGDFGAFYKDYVDAYRQSLKEQKEKPKGATAN
jgi:glycosyltransferase involved in cell wall biosynthesis